MDIDNSLEITNLYYSFIEPVGKMILFRNNNNIQSTQKTFSNLNEFCKEFIFNGSYIDYLVEVFKDYCVYIEYKQNGNAIIEFWDNTSFSILVKNFDINSVNVSIDYHNSFEDAENFLLFAVNDANQSGFKRKRDNNCED